MKHVLQKKRILIFLLYIMIYGELACNVLLLYRLTTRYVKTNYCLQKKSDNQGFLRF